MNFIQTFYLTHFSKPISLRQIYRHIQTEHPQKILEIGIQRCERTVQLLQIVLRFCSDTTDVHYCGIDPFEGRTQNDGAGLSIRKAHHMISQFKIKSRLVPLQPDQAVKQLHVNRLIEKVDLVIIAMPNLCWVPLCVNSLLEIIHETAGIFLGIPIQADEQFLFEKISVSDIEMIAKNNGQYLPNQLIKRVA